MSLIKNALQTEEQKMQKLMSCYEKRLTQLPKGSITAKKRGKNIYYYLSYRKQNKVISQYIGTDIVKLEDLKQDLEKRVHTENMIKGLQKEISLIKKMKEAIQ